MCGEASDARDTHNLMFQVGYVWDEQRRELIRALPEGLASKSHVHTPVETEWLRKLPLHPVPEEVSHSEYTLSALADPATYRSRWSAH